MFTSTRSSESPLYNKRTQKFSETNGISKSIMSPIITSTPLHSMSMNNRRSSLLNTPRNRRLPSPDTYVTPPKYMNSIDPNATKYVHNASGPLLASTQYNINLSTYVDSKSPGYASRVVQYNEERERSLPTHQPRYGSPGMFPVVHLFKKDVPVISPKPRRVTVRIAPSDSSRYNTPEHNKLLLEDMMQESNRNNHHHNDISTRSVLDALKEISRKRIHPGEEYDINEDTVKRHRSDCFIGGSGDTYKRTREDSPKAEGSSQSNKKMCFVDPFYASATSTVLEKERLQKLLSVPSDKTTRSVQVEESDGKEDEVKLVSVETQTVQEETPVLSKPKEGLTKITNQKDDKTVEEDNESGTPARKERKAPLRIFDEKPLEIMRKNRLAVLLGALTGEKPVLIPKEDKLAKLREEMEKEEAEKNADQKQPKSILSTGHKPNTVEKHVTFSSSTFTSSNDTSSDSNSTPATSQNAVKFSPSITQTSTSVVSPVMSASVCDAAKSPSGSENKLTLPQNTPATSAFQSPSGFSFGSNNNNESSKKTDTAPSSQMSFGTPSDKQEAAGVQSSNSQSQSSLMPTSTSSAPSGFAAFKFDAAPPASTTSTSDFGAFKFGGSPKTTASSSSTTQLPSISTSSTASSESKGGGFKFDLSKPNVSATSTPSNFNSTTEKPETTKSLFGSQPSSSTSGPSNNMFGQNTQVSSPASKGGFSFTGASNSENTNITTTSTSAFAAPAPGNIFSKDSTKPSFGSGNVTSSASPAAFKFGGATQETKSSLNETSTNNPVSSSAAPTFSFGQANTDSSGKGSTTSATTGFASANPIAFGSSINTDKSANSGLTATTTSSLPTFGSGSANTSSGFGGSTNAPAFGSNTTSTSGFGAATNAPAFGSNTNIAFGSTSNNNVTFGSNPATTTTSGFGATSTAPAFGSSTATAAPVFGGTASNQPFGSVATSNTSGFGSSNTGASMFNAPATTSSTSATNAAPVFGNAAFGNKSAGFSFGGSNPATTTAASTAFGTTTTASSMFGGATKPQFSLGGASNNTSAFSSTASPFGSTTQATPAFGTTTPSFGTPATTAPTFGASNTTPAFGSAASPFATTTASSSSTPAFGSTTNAPGSIFGAGAAPAFGNAAKPLFGAGASTAFGSNPTTTTSSSMFGNNSAPAFAFGATTTTTATGFGQSSTPAFGTTTTASSSFGSTTTPAFGSTSTFGQADSTFKPGGSSFSATPAFGATNSSSSGPATTSAPSFGLSSGFGSGGSSFGSNASGGFGASSAPAFGSTAPTTNMFGSGFGSGAASAFDSKQQTNLGASSTNAFGGNTTNTGFGSNLQNPPSFPSSTPAQNGVFTFGSSNNTQQPSVGFSFGSSEPTKPSFNFTSGSTAPPSFGATPTPAFGTNPSPAFGANPNGQFTGAPAMFSIGSGPTSSNRARTQLKARRRTDR